MSVATLAALGSACGSGAADEPGGPAPDGPWSYGATIPAEPSEPGDAAKGRHELLHGDYMTCGIPMKLWGTGGDAIAGALGGDPDAPRIADRDGKNADLPYNLNAFTTPDGVEVVNANCLMCHGGVIDGELVVGLGNAVADFTSNGSSVAGSIPPGVLDMLGFTDAEKAQLELLAQRAGAIAEFSVMRTVGHNPAEALAVALMVHHDRETLAWSDGYVTDVVVKDHAGNPIEDPLVTSDPPPWWRAKKKHALFYNGMARGDHRGTMALATSVCVDSVERAEVVDQAFRDIHAYLLTVQAPRYTRAIDEALAAEGKPIFERDCAGCHGSYADDPDDDAADTYPNLLIPLETIGTDPVVAEAGVVHAPQLVDWYNGSFYGRITRMEPSDPFPGYLPPPLDGIWATAPYLHNGSVPTVELVLNSERRPGVWKRVDYDSTHLDEEALGWPWEAVEVPQAELPEAERKHAYDTSYWSQSNRGHTFGDHLTDAERRAVIEYLKTL
jgi:mono/diheme cytochrome c family protein